MPQTAPLDTTTEVVTPENIGFKHLLAGPFRRLPAYLLDFAISTGGFLLVVFFIIVVGGFLGITLGNTIFPAFAAAGMLVTYFAISWFYGVYFETYFNGRTPGKWAMGLRVISADGHPIHGKQALLRNLLRVADLGPGTTLAALDADNPVFAVLPISTGVIGLTVMLCSRRLQRLGDLAAGTIVVIDERNWALPVARVDDERVPALASFIPADYRVSASMAKALAGYTERRAFLAKGRRNEIAKHLAEPLIERFEFRPDIDPDLLLYAMYYRTFLADQQQEPVALGPLAGFSPLLKDIDAQLPLSPQQVPA